MSMRIARPFTQTEIKSAFKAARAAGYSWARVEITLGSGHQMIATASDGATANDNKGSTKNPWDEETQ